MKFLIFIIFSSLSLVAHAGCMAEFEEGKVNINKAVAANNDFHQTYIELRTYFEEWVIIPKEACLKGAEALKLAWNASYYNYASYLNGRNMIEMDCSYGPEISYTGKGIKYDTEGRYKKMYANYLKLRPRIAHDCTMHMNIPEVADPSTLFYHY